MLERRIGGVTDVVVGEGVTASVLDGEEPFVAVLHQPASAQIAATLASPSGAVVREMPDGEDAKTLGEVERTVEWLAAEGMRRDGLIVGIGGGALTDAAGFVASVYMRGVRLRLVPTTLLAAVDAAIGGKTAVNVRGKNLVGTFSHPERVVIDVAILRGLPDQLLSEGMAEVLKAGLVGDPGLFAMVARDGLESDLPDVVSRAVTVKADVVDADFTERGVRAHLNLGHTVGHAIEMLAGWSHGASVAVGMVAAATASELLLGFTARDRLIAALEAVALPVRGPSISAADVMDLLKLDKKATTPDGVRMVLLEGVGVPVVRPVGAATLHTALESIGIT